MKPNVVTIMGTRPEVVKLAPVVRALRQEPRLSSMVCATAQHRDMLDLAARVFEIQFDIDLDLMRTGQQPYEVTSRVLEAMTNVYRRVRPDFVLVQGDTTTALASALAAFYEGIPLGHVEAGLRTGDLANPFPEEMNRKVVADFATLHFAPTSRAREALLREGVQEETIVVTGNTVIDALHLTLGSLESVTGDDRRRILITAHRRESFGTPLENICMALRSIALAHSDVDLIFPVHPNPNVREPVSRLLSGMPNVDLIEPLDYRDFVCEMQRSYLILTDSGGVQEEAPSLDKPVLVMRDTTERPEAVEAGAAKLVGTDQHCIVETCEELLTNSLLYTQMASVPNPFGDGYASERIVSAITEWLLRDAPCLLNGITK